MRVVTVDDVIIDKSIGWRQTPVDLAHDGHRIPGCSHEGRKREKERRDAKMGARKREKEQRRIAGEEE